MKNFKKVFLLSVPIIFSISVISSVAIVSSYNKESTSNNDSINKQLATNLVPRGSWNTSMPTSFTINNQTNNFSKDFSDQDLINHIVRNNLISDLPSNATVKIVDRGLDIGKINGRDVNRSVDNITGQARFKVSISPYYENGNLNQGTLILPNNNKSSPNDFIYAYGFRKFNSKQILFKYSYDQPMVHYSDGTQKTLFSKTIGRFQYFSDWKNPKYQQDIKQSLYDITNLGDYTAQSYIFSEASSYTRMQIDLNSVVLNDTDKTTSFKFRWFGYKQGEPIWYDNASLTLKLKPDPTSEDQIFVEFGNYLQSWINQNHRFPNDNELKQITVDYLNKIKDTDLPVDWIPGGLTGKFTVNDISINQPAIINDEYTISNGNPLKGSTASIAAGAISIVNPINFNFPSYQLTIPTTFLKAEEFSVANDPILSNVLASYVIHSPKHQSDVSNWINNQIKNNVIFENISPISTIKPDSIKYNYDANANKLNVSFILTDTYIADNLACDRAFSIRLIGFSTVNKALDTKLKINQINWNDQLFATIFGANDKGFAIDWNQPNILNQKQQIFLDYVNSHINDFFSNPYQTTIKQINKFTLNLKTGVINIDLDYNGLKNGQYINQLNQAMTINLRVMPSIVDPNDINNAFGLVKKAIQLYCDENFKAPTDEIIAQIVVFVMNEWDGKKQIADFYIPASGTFTINDVLVRSKLPVARNSNLLIERSSEWMFIQADAIILNYEQNNQLNFPELGLFQWEPLVVNYQRAWDKWVKYVVISCSAALIITLIITLFVYLNKKRNSKSLNF